MTSAGKAKLRDHNLKKKIIGKVTKETNNEKDCLLIKVSALTMTSSFIYTLRFQSSHKEHTKLSIFDFAD
jgi:hypothetical protein